MPNCNKVTKKNVCKKTKGCKWSGICLNDGNIPAFTEQCPCLEYDTCTVESLQIAGLLLLGDKWAKIEEARLEFEEEYGEQDNRKVTDVPGYLTQLLNDGVLTPIELLGWYQNAGCDSGLWTDITNPPVHVCLTDSMTSFHVDFESFHGGYWVGDRKKQLASQKTDTTLGCFQSMVRKYKNKNLKLVTFAVDTDDRGGSKKCEGFSTTNIGENRNKGFSERSVAFRMEPEWGCPKFKKSKNCGKIDFEGYLLNLRVDDVGMTDDRCMCQLMCEDRDLGKYIAWTWNVYEGKCTCVYSANKKKINGQNIYKAATRWNNFSGMMNKAKFELE